MSKVTAAPTGSTPKPQKSLFVSHYESLFTGDEPHVTNPAFFDDLFLLKLNVDYLDRLIGVKTEHDLIQSKKVFNLVFAECLKALQDENTFRVAHALETMCILFRNIFRKKFSNFAFDITTLTILLLESDQLKLIAIDLLIILVTATDNVNQNTLMEYFIHMEIFDTLLQVASKATDIVLSFNATIVLTWLANYQKYEITNPYLKRLRDINDDAVLAAVGKVLHQSADDLLRAYSVAFASRQEVDNSPGLLSSVAGYFSYFVSKAAVVEKSSLSPNNAGAWLLTMFECVHENKDFATSMCYQIEDQANKSDVSPRKHMEPTKSLDIGFSSPRAKRLQLKRPELFIEFLKLCSYLFSDIKDAKNLMYSKLALLILTSLAENDEFESHLNNPALSVHVEFPVKPPEPKRTLLSRAPEVDTTPKPLACAVVELLVQFLKFNMKQEIHTELYCRAMDILHRVLCYLKKLRIRLTYSWVGLWKTLLRLTRQLSTKELFAKPETLVLADKTVNIINMFVTFGDQFLPQLSDYDELYYALISEEQHLRTFIELVKEADKGDVYWAHFHNLVTILDHFALKLEAWSASHPSYSLDMKRVMELIRENYETLKLRLSPDLDKYEPFVEYPKEALFFRQLTRTLCTDFKQMFKIHSVDQRRPNV